jgi:hypothetical protein
VSLKEWLMLHLPNWLLPFSPWGEKGRPDMPEKHALVNRQQALRLRIDRLDQRAAREAAEHQHYLDWEQHSGG